MVKVLCLAEVGEVLVVGKDLNQEGRPLKIMAPVLMTVRSSRS